MYKVDNVFEVKWTGGYPIRCSGEWIILYKGSRVAIPEDKVSSHMNTEGSYDTWHFEEWSDVWESYNDGDCIEAWLIDNDWVFNITNDVDELDELFSKIQDQDWRHNSCGGCI